SNSHAQQERPNEIMAPAAMSSNVSSHAHHRTISPRIARRAVIYDWSSRPSSGELEAACAASGRIWCVEARGQWGRAALKMFMIGMVAQDAVICLTAVPAAPRGHS